MVFTPTSTGRRRIAGEKRLCMSGGTDSTLCERKAWWAGMSGLYGEVLQCPLTFTMSNPEKEPTRSLLSDDRGVGKDRLKT